MNKNLFLFLFSLSLGLLFLSPLVSASNQTTTSTYYTSSSGYVTKVQLINSPGGPDGNNPGFTAASSNPCFCASYSANKPGTNGSICDINKPVTYTNTGTIFSDPSSGFLEICQSNGTMLSYPGACYQRYCCPAGNPSCAGSITMCPSPITIGVTLCLPASNYTITSFYSISKFPGISTYSCCFNNQPL